MINILNAPMRVNARSRTVYFFDGDVAAEIVSGSEEQQKAAFVLVGQAQRMARLLRRVAGGACDCTRGADEALCERCEAEKVLRDAGVLGE